GPGALPVVRDLDGQLKSRADRRLLWRRCRAVSGGEAARDDDGLTERLRSEELEPRDALAHEVEHERVCAGGRWRDGGDGQRRALTGRDVRGERSTRAVPDQGVPRRRQQVIAHV